MNTFLDLLIVVVLALAAVSLVAMVLMFLVKNKTRASMPCSSRASATAMAFITVASIPMASA